MIEALRGTHAGKTFVDPSIAGKLVQQVAGQPEQPPSTLSAQLSPRELDVLRLIARGHTNAEIAEVLHLSEGTVRNHVSSIFSKLDVPDRTQAAILAIRYGLDRE